LLAEAWLRATLSSVPTNGPLALLDTTIQNIDCWLISYCALSSAYVDKHSMTIRVDDQAKVLVSSLPENISFMVHQQKHPIYDHVYCPA
jgi:hypothetical protein